jgi:hypothetical protein
LALGAVPFARYGYFVLQGNAAGHVQSLVIGTALWIVGGQLLITGMLATAIAWNRRMMEDVLFRMKEERAGIRTARIAARRGVRAETEFEIEEAYERERHAA